jgi:hypothetical protein
MNFKNGDHICALYSTPDELTREVAAFLAEGLRSTQRCWYVGAGGRYRANPFFDPSSVGGAAAEDADVLGRLEQLDRKVGQRETL